MPNPQPDLLLGETRLNELDPGCQRLNFLALGHKLAATPVPLLHQLGVLLQQAFIFRLCSDTFGFPLLLQHTTASMSTFLHGTPTTQHRHTHGG